MALLLVTKNLENNVYKTQFELVNVTSSEKLLAEQFGEPSYTFGGSFNPTSNSFLTKYFSNSKELIPNWVQFAAYSTDDEVQYTDSKYYRAIQPVSFSEFSNWTQYESVAPLWDDATSYSEDDIVFFGGVFYQASANVSPASPIQDPSVDTDNWTSLGATGGPVVKFTDDKYYKAIREIDFVQFSNWSSIRYSEGNVVKYVPDNNYYIATEDSPATWVNSTQYSLGDIVFYNGQFHEAIVTAPTVGTRIVLTISSVTGTFGTGLVITQTQGAGSGATGTVVSYVGTELTIDVTSGTFTAGSSPADLIETDNSPTTGSATIDSISEPNPDTNTDDWSVTVKTNPDQLIYWNQFTGLNPGQEFNDVAHWEIYTDRDPATSGGAAYWVMFTPSGQEPESTETFSVNQITKFLITGLPVEFEFTSEANANDFAEVVKADVDEVWDLFVAKMDAYSSQEVVDLNA